MIAVDTSVLVAIALKEKERTDFLAKLTEVHAVVGTPTLVEASMVLRSRIPDYYDRFLDSAVRDQMVAPEPFTADMYLAARDAFSRYGKGTGHPAQLNFGDCLSYAVAKVRGVPLLYKGLDFAKTDIPAAL